jgi:DNA polymerase III delta prime subunit
MYAAFERPEQQSRLKAQTHYSQFLSQRLEKGQLAHAYLFKAPVEDGYALAQALSLAIFCPHGGCGECVACKQVLQEQHPDLHLVRGDGEGRHPLIKLKQIQHLITQVTLPPVQSSYQVFILLHAENMQKESSNALLKTLEEPSSNSIIILLTPFLERILPTLRSRSQILSLATPLPSSEDLLHHAEDAEKLWTWQQLEGIRTAPQLDSLLQHLEKLNPAELSLQFEVLQRGCWERIRPFIVEKSSRSGLARAQKYLLLFEEGLSQLRANAHARLVSETFAQKYLQLRQQI